MAEPDFTGKVVVAMTRAEADLFKAFRAVLRERTIVSPGLSEADKAALRTQHSTITTALAPALQAPRKAPAPGLLAAAVEQGFCGVVGPNASVCLRQGGHSQRHRYIPVAQMPKRHVPPPRPWTKTDSFTKTSGSRTYVIKIGHPCKVEGERGLFKVISIEQHAEDGRVNVEVTNDRTGHSRIFPADRIIYKRPRKTS